VTRRLFAPTLLIVFGGTIVGVASSTASHLWILAVVGAAIVFSLVSEWIAPYEPVWNLDRGDQLRDRVHALVNETSSAVGVLALPLLTGAFTIVDAWPGSAPFALQVLLAVVVLDLGITVTHWTSHRIGWLWRFHAVHHSVTRIYGMNGLMKHPVHQLIETLVGVTPLVLVGVPRSVGAAAAGLVAIQLLAQHSNVDYVVGAVGRVLALNSGHRLHHVNDAGDGDVNFGLFTLVWDRMLGTYRDPTSRTVRDGDLGISGMPDYPTGYIDQLTRPFR
jgi:sterol desaturase/sphingolipid hydroxylase (fatty acid hydroxylase superfamily)